MAADRQKMKPTRQYKQRKSKYPSELWDDMPLYKEPKTKRTENEYEIIENYRAMKNKPKRKYKQRKSKYDAELWNCLSLHRERKRMPQDFTYKRNIGITMEGNFVENRKELNMHTNNYVCLSSQTKANHTSTYNENSNNLVMPSTCTDGKTILQKLHQNVSRNGCKSKPNANMERNFTLAESTAKTDGERFVDKLFVQVVLQTLLKEQNFMSRNNMIQMLKVDKKLNSICLEEISKRCGSLDCLPDFNLEKALDEHVILMKLYKYLSLNKLNKSQEVTNGETARKIETSSAQDAASKSFVSSGNGDGYMHHGYEDMNVNIEYIIQSLDANKAQTTTQLQSENLLGQSKPFFAMLGVNGMNSGNITNTSTGSQVSTAAQCLQNEPDGRLFSLNTLEDVCQTLPLLDKSHNSSERFDLQMTHDEDLRSNNDAQEEQFFESADARDKNINELFRLASVISGQI